MLNLFYFLFLGTLGLGGSLYLIKILLISLTPTEIVLYRMLIGTISLLILTVILKLKICNYKFLLIDGLVLGIFNITLPYYLISFAEQTIPSALAAVMNGLTPVFTFLLGMCFFSNQTFNIFKFL